jgi:hypothetical protein
MPHLNSCYGDQTQSRTHLFDQTDELVCKFMMRVIILSYSDFQWFSELSYVISFKMEFSKHGQGTTSIKVNAAGGTGGKS